MSSHTGNSVDGSGMCKVGRLGLTYMTSLLPQPLTVAKLGLVLALNMKPGERLVVRPCCEAGQVDKASHGWVSELCDLGPVSLRSP